MSNANLNAAKKAKNDEFYTMYEDIENELQHYPGAFQGKTVYCNCDNPEWSNFWRYFHENFAALGLKKLVSTHYEKDVEANGHPYKMEYEGGNDADITAGVKTPLECNGDFASDECIEILRQADIVVTNPQFSMFREYVNMLEEHNKKFLIIGNKNAITYKEFFPLLKSNKAWIGYSTPSEFNTPEGMTKKINGLCRWFTNLDIKKRHEKLTLKKKYTPNEFQKYDNYDAINVDKVSNIPCDYCESWEVTAEEFKNFPADEWEITREGELDGEKSFFIIPAKRTPLREGLSEHMPGYKEGIEGELLKYIKKKDIVTESLECQSHSLTSTTQHSLKSLEQQSQKEKDSATDCGLQNQELHSLLSTSSENISACLQERYCNGVAGVPITFLDKYSPDQFEIVNANDYRKAENVPVKPHGLIKDKEAAVKKNCVCQNMHQKETLNCSRLEAMDGISPENGNMQGFLSDRYCNGIIGVPVTFLDKMNPNQFKIIGRADGNIKYDTPECYIPGFADKGGAPMINTKFLYKRILIQKKL